MHYTWRDAFWTYTISINILYTWQDVLGTCHDMQYTLPDSLGTYHDIIARNHGYHCSCIFISQIASCMTSANKRWTIFWRRWSMNADKNSYLFFFLIIFHQFCSVNTYVWQILKKNAQYIFYLHIFIYREKGGGGSAYIFDLLHTSSSS
jgi:hypothetical protein